MAEQRHVMRLGRSLVVALPQLVRHHLGVARGDAVYWFTTRKHEVVLSKRAQRIGGHPEGLSLQRQLAAALAEIERLKVRDVSRDRSLYAEGHFHGYRQAEERLTRPGGRSAARGIRRRLYAYGESRPGEAPPPVSRRRARPGPPPRAVDAIPLPDLPSSPELAGGDVASGGAAPPGHPQET